MRFAVALLLTAVACRAPHSGDASLREAGARHTQRAAVLDAHAALVILRAYLAQAGQGDTPALETA